MTAVTRHTSGKWRVGWFGAPMRIRGAFVLLPSVVPATEGAL